MADAKEGELFRRNYLRSPIKLADSERARRRLYQLFKDTTASPTAFASHVEREIGLRYPRNLRDFDHEGYWTKCQIGDFLSSLTLWLRLILPDQKPMMIARKIFEQEDLHYQIDDKGGVHYLVDEPFAHTVESTLSGLGHTRFTAARHALEAGLKHLGPTHQSGKGLIRGVFEAAETTFLVVAGPDAGKIMNAQAIQKHLKPILLARYQAAPDAEDKVSRMLTGFEVWVKEAHPYRHGTGSGEEVHEAPLDLAILSANTGMGFIRFLAGL
jgi:hypothetical protein